ncbi:hypothetical protein [Isoptericola croceus]|uniref:hypothetical protein n=1 Tax=Isoptericola croceus TaxID=3031406 RepID=UPI0023F8F7E1|nr:hypothetical protein [Isoptericola croceus]
MNAKRHTWLDGTCELIAAVRHGRDAAALLDAPTPAAGAVVVCEAWMWRIAAISVGRKDRDTDTGGRLQLPVGLDWTEGTVHVVDADGDPASLHFVFAGLGHTGTGTVTVRIDPLADEQLTDHDAHGTPARITAPRLRRRDLQARLRDLVEAGQTARWYLRERFEPMVTGALVRANGIVAAEVFAEDAERRHVLDTESLQTVATRMTLGDSRDTAPETPTGRAHPAATDKRTYIDRLIDRCLIPATFSGVDPLMYISRDLNRTAEHRLREHICDPRHGRIVRRMLRERELNSIDDLVAAYNETYPSRRISRTAALAALNPMSTPQVIPSDMSREVDRATSSTWEAA